MDRPWLILRRVVDTGISPPRGANAEDHPVVIDEADAGALEQEEEHAGVGEAEEHVVAVDAAVEAQAQHDAVAEEAEADAAAQPQEEEHAAVAADQAEEGEDAAMEAQVAQLEESVANVNTNQEESELEHMAIGAGQPDYLPDFTIDVNLPPRVSFLYALPDSHPVPARPDVYPYIIATGRFCLLVHFAVRPFYGTNFERYPNPSNLVVVRHFRRDDDTGLGACALHVPDRPHNRVDMPALRNIESVGLVCDQETGDYQIAELIVDTGEPEVLVVYFSSDTDVWDRNYNNNPLQQEDRHRDWVPHGTVAINSTVLWFDLSWGIISCNLAEPLLEQVLHFHRLPHGRVLLAGAGVPDLHCRRLIAVSENLVRYVEIILHPHQAATVNMWYRHMVGNPPWRWQPNYSVSFEDIWADESYAQTGLPQNPPMLVGVSPVNSNVVYFSLNQRLFGVNVPEHTVVDCQEYEPLNRPGPLDEPVTSRYLITWNLDADAAQIVGHQPDELSDHGDSSPRGPADEGEIVN